MKMLIVAAVAVGLVTAVWANCGSCNKPAAGDTNAPACSMPAGGAMKCGTNMPCASTNATTCPMSVKKSCGK